MRGASSTCLIVVCVVSCVVTGPRIAGAQIYESIGTRAQGMGGAFVAVADDATATWWNPAGLAGSDLFSAVVEIDRAQEPRAAPAPGAAAWRTGSGGVAIAFPSLGVSYYRLRLSEIQPPTPTAGVVAGRQDQGIAPVGLRSLLLQQVGATIGQSIGDHLVVASTLKLVKSSTGADVRAAADATLDAASDLERHGDTTGDLDVGAMATFGAMRLGVAVRNLREPTLGAGDASTTVPRQGRAGASFTTGSRGSLDALTVAIDADLTRTAMPGGEVRHVAAGAEAWLAARRIGVRGGVSANTVGDARPAASGGVSVGLWPRIAVDGAGTVGSDRSRAGWGVALRVTF